MRLQGTWTDRQGDSYIHPQTLFAGGIIISTYFPIGSYVKALSCNGDCLGFTINTKNTRFYLEDNIKTFLPSNNSITHAVLENIFEISSNQKDYLTLKALLNLWMKTKKHLKCQDYPSISSKFGFIQLTNADNDDDKVIQITEKQYSSPSLIRLSSFQDRLQTCVLR